MSEPVATLERPVPVPDARLPTGVIWWYSAPRIAFGIMGLLFGTYLLKFSTDVLLIAPGVIGTLIAGDMVSAQSSIVVPHARGGDMSDYLDSLHRLLNGQWYFPGLAATETDPTVAVTDHRERGKTEDPATFHNLGHPVHLNQFFDQAFFLNFVGIRH